MFEILIGILAIGAISLAIPGLGLISWRREGDLWDRGREAWLDIIALSFAVAIGLGMLWFIGSIVKAIFEAIFK